MKRLFIIGWTLMLVSCASTYETEQPIELRFFRGSVTLPEIRYWQIQNLPRPGKGKFATYLLSPTHSIAALLKYDDDFSNIEAYHHWSRPRERINQHHEILRRSFSEGRYKLISFDSSPKMLKNAECNEYRVHAEDFEVPGYKGKAHPFRAIGLSCNFTDRLLFLHVAYSERRSASEQPLPTFDDEAAKFLDGLVVE